MVKCNAIREPHAVQIKLNSITQRVSGVDHCIGLSSAAYFGSLWVTWGISSSLIARGDSEFVTNYFLKDQTVAIDYPWFQWRILGGIRKYASGTKCWGTAIFCIFRCSMLPWLCVSSARFSSNSFSIKILFLKHASRQHPVCFARHICGC